MREGRKFDRVVVHSSPFIRTMASTARVCKELRIKKANLDYQLSEYLNINVYSTDPLAQLEYKKLPAD